MRFETFLEGYYKGTGRAIDKQYHHEDSASKYDDKQTDHRDAEMEHRRESTNSGLTTEQRLEHRRKANFHAGMVSKAGKLVKAHNTEANKHKDKE